MLFDELTEDNYLLFAIKHYDNPQAATKEDFFEDLRRFKYIKRLLKVPQRQRCKDQSILNHIIIVYNVFNDAAHYYCSTRWSKSIGRISKLS